MPICHLFFVGHPKIPQRPLGCASAVPWRNQSFCTMPTAFAKIWDARQRAERCGFHGGGLGIPLGSWDLQWWLVYDAVSETNLLMAPTCWQLWHTFGSISGCFIRDLRFSWITWEGRVYSTALEQMDVSNRWGTPKRRFYQRSLAHPRSITALRGKFVCWRRLDLGWCFGRFCYCWKKKSIRSIPDHIYPVVSIFRHILYYFGGAKELLTASKSH